MAKNENSFTFYYKWLIHSVDTPSYFQFRIIPIKVIFLYAAVTVLIATSIVSLVTAVQSYRQLGEMAEIYRTHFPPMEIVDGKLIVSGDTPVMYSGEEIQIIVDVSEKTSRLDTVYTKGMIFQETQLIFFNGINEPAELPYSQLTLGDIDADSFFQYRGGIAMGMLIVLEILFLLRWVISKALYVVLASFFVGLISEMHRVILARNHRLIIAVTAVIPIIFLETIETLIQNANLVSLMFPTVYNGFLIFNLSVYGLLIILGTRSYIAPFIAQNPQGGSDQ